MREILMFLWILDVCKLSWTWKGISFACVNLLTKTINFLFVITTHEFPSNIWVLLPVLWLKFKWSMFLSICNLPLQIFWTLSTNPLCSFCSFLSVNIILLLPPLWVLKFLWLCIYTGVNRLLAIGFTTSNIYIYISFFHTCSSLLH